jgi:hypothetical protein
MFGLAGFAMRGRSQAAMAATVLAMLALLVPVLSILSSAVVALVTLRQGLADGLVVGAISALASGLLAFLLLGTPAPVLGFLLVLWLPVWILGVLLRTTRSLNLAVQAALVFGALLLAVFYLMLGQPEARWAELVTPVADSLVHSGVLDTSAKAAFVQVMAAWMNGVFAAGFYLQLVLALLLARAWQARLYNPGGFREEFGALRASRPLGIVALPLLGLLLLQGVEAPALGRDLGVLLAPLFFLQGLAVAHYLVHRSGMHWGWLMALYLLLFLAMPHAEILVTLVGLADVLLDFRRRFASGAPPAD